METWLQEYLESERDSMFQNDSLNLPNRNITQIDWIPENRYSINLGYNKLRWLPNLHSHIGYLTLTNNQIQSLPLLPKRLMFLNIEGNPITELPDLPRGLNLLRASYCMLTSLPSLPRNLQYLHVAFNNLYRLPELPDGLIMIDIRENKIHELPYLPESLQQLMISGNPSLQKYFGKTLGQIRDAVKQRIAKERCRIFKEELMMVVWHPRRVEKLVMAGIDFEDM